MSTIFEVGEDFPGSRSELEAWFATEEDCRAFLDDLRWGDGFECPALRPHRALADVGRAVAL